MNVVIQAFLGIIMQVLGLHNLVILQFLTFKKYKILVKTHMLH
jgi:hypothetical protein